MMKQLITAVVLLGYCLQAFAIDETESLRQRSQQKAQYTNLSLDLSGKGGNSETENFEFGLYHSRRHEQHFGFIMATREYATSFDVESANNAFVHLRYNYYFAEHDSIEVFAQTNEDNFRSLESRKLVGLSYRHEITQAQAWGVGLFTEHEDYLVQNKAQTFEQVRLNLYWVYAKQISPTSFIANTFYYQPNVETTSDFRAYNKLSIKTAITDRLYMSFGLLAEHDSRPVLDIEKTDYSYNAGFEFEF